MHIQEKYRIPTDVITSLSVMDYVWDVMFFHGHDELKNDEEFLLKCNKLFRLAFQLGWEEQTKQQQKKEGK